MEKEQDYKVRIYKVDGKLGYTVQGDSVEDVVAMYEQIKEIGGQEAPISGKEYTKPIKGDGTRVEGAECEKCGVGIYKRSKAGKLYCSNLCWQTK